MKRSVSLWAFALALIVVGQLGSSKFGPALEAANRLYIEPKTVNVGDTNVEIPILLDSDQPLYGFSLSLVTDVALLEIKSVTVAGTVVQDAQFADGMVFENGRRVSYGVVMTVETFDVNKKIPQGTGLLVAKLIVDVKATEETTANVQFEDVPASQGSAPAKNVLVGDEGLPLSLSTVPGVITIKKPPVGPIFLRGDSNNDGRVDLSDAVFHLNYLFRGGDEPPCLKASDSDDNGALEITDAIYTLNYLFLGGPVIPPPYPDPGLDTTPDPLSCNI